MALADGGRHAWLGGFHGIDAQLAHHVDRVGVAVPQDDERLAGHELVRAPFDLFPRRDTQALFKRPVRLGKLFGQIQDKRRRDIFGQARHDKGKRAQV